MKHWLLVILLLLPSLVMCEDKGMPPSINEVKKRHEARWLGLRGVVSVGIGLDKDGQSAIIIGLDRPDPDTEAQLPSIMDGYPVVVRIVGPIKVQ